MDDFDEIADGPLIRFIQSITEIMVGRAPALAYTAMAVFCIRARFARAPTLHDDGTPEVAALLKLHRQGLEDELKPYKSLKEGPPGLTEAMGDGDLWNELSSVDVDAYSAHLDLVRRVSRSHDAGRRLLKDKVADHLYREWMDRHQRMVLHKVQQAAHVAGFSAEVRGSHRGAWSIRITPRGGT